MLEATSIGERLEIMAKVVSNHYPSLKPEELKIAAMSHYKKLLAAHEYTPSDKLAEPVLLVKAEGSAELQLAHDYQLSEVCSGQVEVHTVPGNHYSFIIDENAQRVADIIKNWIWYFYEL